MESVAARSAAKVKEGRDGVPPMDDHQLNRQDAANGKENCGMIPYGERKRLLPDPDRFKMGLYA